MLIIGTESLVLTYSVGKKNVLFDIFEFLSQMSIMHHNQVADPEFPRGGANR